MNPDLLKKWLVALVKANGVIQVNAQIYPDEAPDGTSNPCVVYQYLGAEFEVNMASTLDDASHAIQCRIYADTRSEADQLRADLAERLLGACGETIAPGVVLEHTEIDNFADTFDSDDGSYGATFVWTAINS